MDERELSERKRLILQAIVESHIRYGEPVGSKSLTSNQQLNCSSATIRNEMAELESLGLLEQPHTSAGRVPTELGYRFYVDSLAKQYRMTAMEIAEIERTLKRKIGALDQILEDASRLVSHFTNYTAVAIKPRSSSAKIARFESAYIGERSFVLVMLFGDGTVKTKNVYIPISISQEELADFVKMLNLGFTELTAEEITLSRMVEAEKFLGNLAPLVHPTVKAIYEAMHEMDGGELKIDGVNRLLEYPEYSDVSQLKEMLDLFEHKESLLRLVSSGEEGKDLQVHIGSENAIGAMSNSAFIYRTVRRGGKVVGAVGVIGPTRMDYSRVIAILNHLSDGITDAIGNGEKEDDV
jgi:heat-inducible transcriptional repressor